MVFWYSREKTSLEEYLLKKQKPEYLSGETRVRDLLQMRAGLKWEEKYDQYCSATQMLFDSDDALSDGCIAL